MNLVLFGDSNYAELVKYYFELDTEYKVVGFCVDSKYRTKDELCGLPVVDYENIEKHFPKENHSIFAAIGYKSMRFKKRAFEKINSSGYKIATYVSKSVIVDNSNKIGENCMILPGVILEPFATVESNSFLNSGVTVCQHSTIGSHSFLAAKALVGGYAYIGENSFLGFHSTVLQQIKLEKETLIAAGSVMMQNSEAYTLYAGSPAKPKKRHIENGIEII